MAINPTPFTPKTSKKKVNPIFLMLAIALFLGLSAAFGIWQYLTKTKKEVKDLAKTQKIVVASKEIMAGIVIMAEHLTTQEVPVQTIPQGSIPRIQPLIGRITKGSIQPNEILTETKLVPQGTAGGLAGIIPPGMRALTIKVNDETGIAGFVKPGARVDILSIRRGNDTVSKIIMENVLVIAVGNELYDPNKVSAPDAMIVPQITVALDTTSSEKLALAASSSQLRLLLRPHGDRAVVASQGVNLEDVYNPQNNSEDFEEEILTTVAEPKDSIDIILGNRRTKYFYY